MTVKDIQQGEVSVLENTEHSGGDDNKTVGVAVVMVSAQTDASSPSFEITASHAPSLSGHAVHATGPPRRLS